MAYASIILFWSSYIWQPGRSVQIGDYVGDVVLGGVVDLVLVLIVVLLDFRSRLFVVFVRLYVPVAINDGLSKNPLDLLWYIF